MLLVPFDLFGHCGQRHESGAYPAGRLHAQCLQTPGIVKLVLAVRRRLSPLITFTYRSLQQRPPAAKPMMPHRARSRRRWGHGWSHRLQLIAKHWKLLFASSWRRASRRQHGARMRPILTTSQPGVVAYHRAGRWRARVQPSKTGGRLTTPRNSRVKPSSVGPERLPWISACRAPPASRSRTSSGFSALDGRSNLDNPPGS